MEADKGTWGESKAQEQRLGSCPCWRCRIGSKVRARAACLGENMTFALRSRMRIECEQGARDSSDADFKKREKPSLRVHTTSLALLVSQFI